MPAALPRVSILMPCYNAEKTLAEALDSLASQTLSDYEVVAVEDGSSDETLRLLEARAARDERIRVIAQAHAGIAEALDAGLAACRAEYVARMDADDRCHPQRLARQVAYLEEHRDVSVVSCLVSGFPQEKVREGFRIYMAWLNSLVTDEQIQCEMFVESPLAHPSVVFRKADILRVGGYQPCTWPEDYDLWLRLYLGGGHFGKVSKELFEWREDPGRLTRADSHYSLENFLRAKAYYLARGPLLGCDGVILWGAGMAGRRLSKHLMRQGCPLVAFIDIDPDKIGNTRRGLPILSPQDLPAWLSRYQKPIVLVAVGARGARAILRKRLQGLALREARDWWFVA